MQQTTIYKTKTYKTKTFNFVLKPLSIALASWLAVACSSTPNQSARKQPTRVVVPQTTQRVIIQQPTQPTTQAAKVTQQSAALLDLESLDELESLLEATDMTMVENSALLVQQYGNLWDRMRANFKMNANQYDPRIEAQKSWFISRQDYLNRLTARASRYLYHTVREAERRNIPTELALLPVIESSYDPNATSNAAAAGLWQFIPSTGRIYGLNQTSSFDGRRDVIESTRAAYDFLTALYNQFGSWELALAAYNAGPGRVQQAISANQARGLPTDYWSLRLPTETMNYVPRFMAVAQIVKNPGAYGVYLPAIANRQHFRSVPAGVGTSLYDVSRLTGVNYEELYALNGGLLNSVVDSAGPNRILIPNDVNTSLDAKISQLRGGASVWSAQSPSSWSGDGSFNNTTTSRRPTAHIPTTTSNTRLPSSSSDLAAMATSMVQQQNTNYVAPMPSVANSSELASFGNSTYQSSEPPISTAQQQSITAEMQSANTLPTTSATITSNNTVMQEPPLTQAERDMIAQQIAQVSPDQPIISQRDGNIKLDAIQTQQSVLEARGESRQLSFKEPSVKWTPASDSATSGTSRASSSSAANTQAAPIKKPKPQGTRTTYQVKRGDNLQQIANQLGVNWRDIAEWNQIDANAPLYVGTTLYIYNAKPNNKDNRPDSYTVQAGDTLTGIAAKYGLSISELARYNNLPVNYQVRTKQSLWLVPGKVTDNTSNANQNSQPSKPSARSSADGKPNRPDTYTVQAGDTLTGIAAKYDLSIGDLARFNNIPVTYQVRTQQKLSLVPSKNPDKPASTASNSGSSKVATSQYTVQTGDTLIGIADRLSVSADDIAALNDFNAQHRVQLGQTINVPAKAAAKLNNSATKTTTSTSRPTSYTVKAGDGLISLAKQFDLSTSELAKANNLSPTDNLLVGQKLTIPKAGANNDTASDTKSSRTSSKTSRSADSDDNSTTIDYKGATERYTVKAGDGLINLASQYGISTAQLAAMNNLKPNANLLKGQRIRVPKTTTTYKVKAGDGLINLASKYNISTKELADMNGLSPTADLKIGQTLTVPVR
ncbi:LysM peptidoglycan-binding domain-containing protein [Moraxella atlantae]|uniref:LysM peptidoglycan-binding domain-containing protein n=1 Tax=Faucicola atlantae TaxID=34059 RepID=UPI003751C41D